jgi:hypothetical protein
MTPYERRPPSRLWAVTCYFNPAGYRRKLANFKTFRERLAVPLVAVEQGFDGRFELGRDDADILVRATGGDILWQKERLLNAGVKTLPPSCDAVAWLDCDVIFGDADWADMTMRALGRLGLVHLFHERHNLRPDEPLDRLTRWTEPATSVSAVHKIATGRASFDDLIRNNAQLELRSTVGLAWAIRREVLDAHGLYDASILGGGDRVMTCAALGEFAAGVRANHMNSRRAEHYLAWARPFFATVQGRVGAIPGSLFHLWHGELKDRRYEERLDLLDGFDPHTDIAAEAGGCWRWSSDKPGLHAAVRRYFEMRNEDGVEADESAVSMAGAREE